MPPSPPSSHEIREVSAPPQVAAWAIGVMIIVRQTDRSIIKDNNTLYLLSFNIIIVYQKTHDLSRNSRKGFIEK